jgi:hypothetical protein
VVVAAAAGKDQSLEAVVASFWKMGQVAVAVALAAAFKGRRLRQPATAWRANT